MQIVDQLLVYRPSVAPFQASASDPSWLHFEPPQLLNFDFDADPDLDLPFDFDADGGPGSCFLL